MELPIHNNKGEVVGQAEVAEVLFGAPVNRPLLHQVLVAQLSNHRAGTHSTKTRAEVSGGGRKPRPQKGTGRARQGSTRSPQWKGGGIVFGPRPRSHYRDIPKKMRRLALRSAISSRTGSQELILLDSLAIDVPKTQDLRIALKNVGAYRSTLVVIGEPTPSLALSARNLPRVRVLPADRLNVEDVLRYHRVVMTVDAVRKAEELWARPLTKKEQELAVLAEPKAPARRTRRSAKAAEAVVEAEPAVEVPEEVVDEAATTDAPVAEESTAEEAPVDETPAEVAEEAVQADDATPSNEDEPTEAKE